MNLYETKDITYVRGKDSNIDYELDQIASDLIKRNLPVEPEYKEALETIILHNRIVKKD